MRIVGGKLKGRAMKAPEGRDVRPTSDRAREAIFNILLNGRPNVNFEAISVLDVFAGSGALGLEALSRGAGQAAFLDSNPASIDCIRDNAKSFGVADHCLIIRHDALHAGAKPFSMIKPATLVFIDPPYHQNLALASLAGLRGNGWLGDDAVIVVESEAKLKIEAPEGFSLIDSRKYGAARVAFLKNDTTNLL